MLSPTQAKHLGLTVIASASREETVSWCKKNLGKRLQQEGIVSDNNHIKKPHTPMHKSHTYIYTSMHPSIHPYIHVRMCVDGSDGAEQTRRSFCYRL